MKKVISCLAILLLSALGAAAQAGETPQPPKSPNTQSGRSSALNPEGGQARGAEGRLSVTLIDILNNARDGKVELYSGGAKQVLTVSAGRGEGSFPAGTYEALVYIEEEDIPLLVTAREVTIQAGATTALPYSLLEGTSGNRLLREFDRDFDLAIDRAEIEAGTNPEDPTSIPGRPKLEFPDPVKGKEKRWYRGELHAQSRHGRGTESVGELIRRAEQQGLDFLAIADINTLAAAQDPEFKSSSVVLIPAMAWGSDEHGYALLYGPKTHPEPAATHTEAQAVARLVQAQGGIVAAAHPCFPTLGWKWYMPGVNAVEVWARDWGMVPPSELKALPGELKAKTQQGNLIHSIAAAADTRGLSANGQACLFWDYELVVGRKVAAIAGSMTGSPSVPMGKPLTCVFAEEKSVRGILDGLRKGRSYVTSGLDGPKIEFFADAMRDKKVDVGMGGAVPIGLTVDLIAEVRNAKGKKLEILYNGLPIYSHRIEDNVFAAKVPQKPEAYSVYRMRVMEPAGPDVKYGPLNVLALSSPIYAEGIIIVPEGVNPEGLRLQVQGKEAGNNPYVSPTYATKVEGPDGEGEYLHIERAPQARPAIPLGSDPLPDPSREKVFEIQTREFSLDEPGRR